MPASADMRRAALLTPQGKIVVDFFAVAVGDDEGGGFLDWGTQPISSVIRPGKGDERDIQVHVPSDAEPGAYQLSSPALSLEAQRGPGSIRTRQIAVLVSDGVAVHRYDFGDPDGMSDHRPQRVSVSL